MSLILSSLLLLIKSVTKVSTTFSEIYDVIMSHRLWVIPALESRHLSNNLATHFTPRAWTSPELSEYESSGWVINETNYDCMSHNNESNDSPFTIRNIAVTNLRSLSSSSLNASWFGMTSYYDSYESVILVSHTFPFVIQWVNHLWPWIWCLYPNYAELHNLDNPTSLMMSSDESWMSHNE